MNVGKDKCCGLINISMKAEEAKDVVQDVLIMLWSKLNTSLAPILSRCQK
ncbi:MAG: hypothetical protein JWR02_2715 [Mucilaginibacter sp.]|nr:hypothetical protein [Mucilaginibacter sp.]